MYIITGKNLDHVYDAFQHGGKTEDYETTSSGVTKHYKFANVLELNASCPDVKVNYVEYNETGVKKKFFSSWISDIKLNKDNLARIVASGRARWRIALAQWLFAPGMSYILA